MARGAKREKHNERGSNRQKAMRHATQSVQTVPRWAWRRPLKGAPRASQTTRFEAGPAQCALCEGPLLANSKRPVCNGCRAGQQGDKPWDNDGEHRIKDDYRTNGAWTDR